MKPKAKNTSTCFSGQRANKTGFPLCGGDGNKDILPIDLA